MEDLGLNALDWLVRNRRTLAKNKTAFDDPDYDEFATIVQKYFDNKDHGSFSDTSKRHLYLVGFEVFDKLPRQVVDNYIYRALKRYGEKDPQGSFNSVVKPLITVKPIDDAPEKEDALRQTIRLAKHIGDFLTPYYQRVGEK